MQLVNHKLWMRTNTLKAWTMDIAGAHSPLNMFAEKYHDKKLSHIFGADPMK